MTFRCIYCGEPAICFDHVIPSSQGGSDEDDNLVPSCIGCNSAKGDRPLDYFLRHDPEVFSRVQLYLKGEYDLSEMPPTGPFRTKGSAWDLGEQRATTFRLSTETHTALNVLAAQHGIPAKKIILDGIADQFARYGVTTEVK